MHERQRDRRGVEAERRLALEVASDRGGQHRVLLLHGEQRAHQDEVGRSRHELHHAPCRDRDGGKVRVARPVRHDGIEGQPEQEVQVRPQHTAIHVANGVHQVMWVAPVDAEHDEAHHVAADLGQHRTQNREVAAVRHPELQHHDGDDDGDHAVAERFHPPPGHGAGVSDGGVRSHKAPAARLSCTRMSTDSLLEFRTAIAASPARVFAALTTGDGLARWFCARAESEPLAGGRLVMSWSRPGGSRLPFEGQWVEVHPPVGAAFEGGNADYPGGYAGRVEFELTGEDGGTVLVTRHLLPGRAEYEPIAERYRGAWPRALARLVESLSGP